MNDRDIYAVNCPANICTPFYLGFPPNHNERPKYLQPILQTTMTQSTALATSRTRYGLREPKMKAEIVMKENNQRRDRCVSNLEGKGKLSINQMKRDKAQIDLGRSNSRPGVHDAKSVRTRNGMTARKL